jgi:predicted HAD superfamily Cof-like phosphohydrolase
MSLSFSLKGFEMSMQDQVREFHKTFGAPVAAVPRLLTRERYELRKSLIEEELVEYMVAFEKGDIVEIADALGDILYVVLGTALEHGMNMEAIVTEIHESNMSKLGDDGKPIYREDGKILKGPNFYLPKLRKVLWPDTEPEICKACGFNTTGRYEDHNNVCAAQAWV